MLTLLLMLLFRGPDIAINPRKSCHGNTEYPCFLLLMLFFRCPDIVIPPEVLPWHHGISVLSLTCYCSGAQTLPYPRKFNQGKTQYLCFLLLMLLFRGPDIAIPLEVLPWQSFTEDWEADCSHENLTN